VFYRSCVDIKHYRFVITWINKGKSVVIWQWKRLSGSWTHKVLVFNLPEWFSHHSIIYMADDTVRTRSNHWITHVDAFYTCNLLPFFTYDKLILLFYSWSKVPKSYYAVFVSCYYSFVICLKIKACWLSVTHHRLDCDSILYIPQFNLIASTCSSHFDFCAHPRAIIYFSFMGKRLYQFKLMVEYANQSAWVTTSKRTSLMSTGR
jgi:hypothetical protein